MSTFALERNGLIQPLTASLASSARFQGCSRYPVNGTRHRLRHDGHKVARTALAANTAVAAMFTVGGSTADITLTRLPLTTLTIPGGTLNIYAADDATLNLAIPSGLGVTADATSTDTTAGVASAGVKTYDAAANFEGNTVETIDFHSGFLVKCTLGECVLSATDFSKIMKEGGVFLDANNTNALDYGGTFTITSDVTTDITLTVTGERA